MKRWPALVIPVLALLSLGGCKSKSFQRDAARAPTLGTSAGFSTADASSPEPAARSERAPAADEEIAMGEDADFGPRQRLGTEFGERHHSRSHEVRFRRSSTRPDAVLTIRYDDVDVVRTMARHNASFRSTGAVSESGDRRFRMVLLDDRGEILPGGDTGGERFAVGQAGVRYRIGIENSSDERFEVVASVDGLDVIDGDEATLSNRGYVVDAFSSVVIDGWRTSNEDVAAFRFSAMDDSYAGRTGRARNVGVIGAAFFAEDTPQFDRAEHGRFAQPPPPRARAFPSSTRRSDRWW